jgi:hypothetical protein
VLYSDIRKSAISGKPLVPGVPDIADLIVLVSGLGDCPVFRTERK